MNPGNNNQQDCKYPYYQPKIPNMGNKRKEDVCLQEMADLREQHSKSTQQLTTQLNLAKELVKENVIIKEGAMKKATTEHESIIGGGSGGGGGGSSCSGYTVASYSASADEVQQMRRQNRLGKTSLAAMKYLSSVDHRRSSSLLGVNTIIHKKKPVNCSENVQYCQYTGDEEKHEETLHHEEGGTPQRRSQTNLLH